jgi:hypothetical protein
VLADFVNGDQVRMMQAGHGLRFPLEAGQIIYRSRTAKEKHLDGDNPIQADLPRSIHDAHAAVGDHGEELVVTEAPGIGARKRLERMTPEQGGRRWIAREGLHLLGRSEAGAYEATRTEARRRVGRQRCAAFRTGRHRFHVSLPGHSQ